MKEIALTQGKVAIVDDGDFEWLNQWKWHYNASTGYAARRDWRGKKYVMMHRLINATPDRLETDHINGDRLDNRRCNLRNATRSQNGKNGRGMPNTKSRFKGISPYDGYYHVRIMVNGKQFYFGRYRNERAAAKVYDYAAIKFHGDFAQLNLPDEPLLTEDEFYMLILPKPFSSAFYGANAAMQLESQL